MFSEVSSDTRQDRLLTLCRVGQIMRAHQLAPAARKKQKKQEVCLQLLLLQFPNLNLQDVRLQYPIEHLHIALSAWLPL